MSAGVGVKRPLPSSAQAAAEESVAQCGVTTHSPTAATKRRSHAREPPSPLRVQLGRDDDDGGDDDGHGERHGIMGPFGYGHQQDDGHEDDEILPSLPTIVEVTGGGAGGGAAEVDSIAMASHTVGADMCESNWGSVEEEEDDHDEEDELESNPDADDGGLWGLPPVVGEILGQRGITQFYGRLIKAVLVFDRA